MHSHHSEWSQLYQPSYVSLTHDDTVSSIPTRRLMVAGTSPAGSGQTNTSRRWVLSSVSGRSSTRRRSWEPDLPLLQPKHMETLKALLRKLGHSECAAQLMTSTLRPSSIHLYKNHWQGFVIYCQWKNFNVFEVQSTQFCNYLCSLFYENTAISTIIQYRTLIGSVLRRWSYDTATDPNMKMLIRLAQPVQRCSMPQWNLHLVLMSLLKPPFASAGSRPMDRDIELKWRTLKICFLLSLATARWRSFMHAFSMAPAHISFVQGTVDGQSTVSLLPKPSFIAKNQLPDQVPSWVKVPGIDHLVPQDSDRMLCPVRKLYLYINDTKHVRSGRTRLFPPHFATLCLQWVHNYFTTHSQLLHHLFTTTSLLIAPVKLTMTAERKWKL